MKYDDFKNEGTEAAVKVFKIISALDSALHVFFHLITYYYIFYFISRLPASIDSKDVIM